MNGQAASTGDTASLVTDAPVRMARTAVVSGDVAWRPDANSNWSPATVNLPLRQGAQISVGHGGRSELQFDDGSTLRLGSGAVATLPTMYSDGNGEYTEVKLTGGQAYLHSLRKNCAYQVDTPYTSVKCTDPSLVRIDADDNVDVDVHEGNAELVGLNSNCDLNAGQAVVLHSAEDAYNVQPLPADDDWDNWCDRREQTLIAAQSDPAYQYVPSNIAICSDNLASYGTWHDDPDYGHVWCPRVTQTDWRPYRDGRWVWVDPFGWTWVGNEAWGWAPYHYGTWTHRSYGWGWVPGPSHQYWCPAVVDYSVEHDNVAWCALSPSEVVYPSTFSIGVWGRNWSVSFSIGGVGCYIPGNDRHCYPQPWRSSWVNRSNVNIYNTTIYNTTIINRTFVPANARYGGGVYTTRTGFTGRDPYRPVPSGREDIFQHGTYPVHERGTYGPVAGPAYVRPTQVAYSPSRNFTTVHFAPGRENRAVVRAQLPPAVQRNNQGAGQFRFVQRGQNRNVQAGNRPNATPHPFVAAAPNSTSGNRPPNPNQRFIAPPNNGQAQHNRPVYAQAPHHAPAPARPVQPAAHQAPPAHQTHPAPVHGVVPNRAVNIHPPVAVSHPLPRRPLVAPSHVTPYAAIPRAPIRNRVSNVHQQVPLRPRPRRAPVVVNHNANQPAPVRTAPRRMTPARPSRSEAVAESGRIRVAPPYLERPQVRETPAPQRRVVTPPSVRETPRVIATPRREIAPPVREVAPPVRQVEPRVRRIVPRETPTERPVIRPAPPARPAPQERPAQPERRVPQERQAPVVRQAPPVRERQAQQERPAPRATPRDKRKDDQGR